jgi:hypothetical protein
MERAMTSLRIWLLAALVGFGSAAAAQAYPDAALKDAIRTGSLISPHGVWDGQPPDGALGRSLGLRRGSGMHKPSRSALPLVSRRVERRIAGTACIPITNGVPPCPTVRIG